MLVLGRLRFRSNRGRNWRDGRRRIWCWRCVWKGLAKAKVWHRKQSHLRQDAVLSWRVGSELGVLSISVIICIAAGVAIAAFVAIALGATFLFALALSLSGAATVKSYVGDGCSGESPFALFDGHYVFRRPRVDAVTLTFTRMRASS